MWTKFFSKSPNGHGMNSIVLDNTNNTIKIGVGQDDKNITECIVKKDLAMSDFKGFIRLNIIGV